MYRIFLLLIGLLALARCKRLAESDCIYDAALVSYHPVTDGDGPTMAEANARNYQKIIADAANYGADIVVFPEYSLTSIPKDKGQVKERPMDDTAFRAFFRHTASRVPAFEEDVIICANETDYYAKSLRMISCSAQANGVYVVVNHLERVDCSSSDELDEDCPSDGFLLYNSQVVFDRSGRVIGHYRKYNLFNEPGVNVTAEPMMSTFATDFGVTFGTFICFDVLNERPATWFKHQPRVENVVYSTHWFNEHPFHHAMQAFGSYAYAADVNFLVSGYSDGPTQSGGFGVFYGTQDVHPTINVPVTKNSLLVVRVPKTRREACGRVHAATGLLALKDYMPGELPVDTVYKLDSEGKQIEKLPLLHFREDMSKYRSLVVKPDEENRATICHNETCCEFHVHWQVWDKRAEAMARDRDYKTYTYRMVAFDGVRPFHDFMVAGVQICAVVACAGPELEDCSTRWNSFDDTVLYPSSFRELKIDLKFPADEQDGAPERSSYAPTTFRGVTERSLEPYEYEFKQTEAGIGMELVNRRDRVSMDLLTFGIYGRRFDRDVVYTENLKHMIEPEQQQHDDGSGEKESHYCHQDSVDGCIDGR